LLNASSRWGIFALARNESAGEHLRFGGKSVIVRMPPNLTGPRPSWLFAAGVEASAAYVEDATNAGCLVIDLSGLFALEPDVPLVVPDVNPFVLAITATATSLRCPTA
jgi:aspartate-semialdehyde dehydrogenase